MVRLLRALVVATALAAAWPVAAQSPDVAWNGEILKREAAWYATAEAHRIADSVILHQSPEGGWPKNTPLTVPPGDPPIDPRARNTFDNQATTLPMAFLARVITAGERPSDRAAFERGLDYVLAAQYPNGGWPQFYPLRDDYSRHITFNDDAMVRVMSLLRDVASGVPPYGFVDEADRARAAGAVERGVALMLATQIRQDGVPTGWAAQYDEQTLAPAWARRYEPPSLSGSESVGVVRFLMALPDPSPEVVASVDGAVAWFRSVAVRDMRFETFTAEDGREDARLVASPGATSLWARFYELGTNRPIFLGRDSVVHYEFAPVERERRTGYRYFGVWPAALIDEDYPRWKRRIASTPPPQH